MDHFIQKHIFMRQPQGAVHYIEYPFNIRLYSSDGRVEDFQPAAQGSIPAAWELHSRFSHTAQP